MSILGNKHFLYHSTMVERIDAALGSLAWLGRVEQNGVVFDTDKKQTITGVLGSCSKGNHLYSYKMRNKLRVRLN